MEKIRLADGTAYDILGGASINSVSLPYTTTEQALEMIDNMTQENLATIWFLNESGNIVGVYDNMQHGPVSIDTANKTITVGFTRRDEVAIHLDELDAALVELADLVAGLQEG